MTKTNLPTGIAILCVSIASAIALPILTSHDSDTHRIEQPASATASVPFVRYLGDDPHIIDLTPQSPAARAAFELGQDAQVVAS